MNKFKNKPFERAANQSGPSSPQLVVSECIAMQECEVVNCIDCRELEVESWKQAVVYNE